jgi:hypothetical protein
MDNDWRRRCEQCGELLGEHAHGNKRFCSKRCKNRFHNGLIADARAEARAALTCLACGGSLREARRRDRKYCSLRCMWRDHYRRRRRERGKIAARRGPTERSAHMATDQISFYDESLKKQIEGTFISDGKKIHIRSAYGNKSVPYNDLGASIDHNSQVLFVKKLLSELARAGGGNFKDLSISKGDQGLEPMQKPFVGGASGWGSWN